MIAGNQLAKHHVEQTMPSSSASNPLRIAWHEVRFPVQIITKLHAATETMVPMGYEDETGFHCSMKASDWFFSI
jgi:hypothetical protein